jgi:predicted Zn-dependent protease with MMP-like domain
MNRHHIDNLVIEIRKRMRARWTQEQIIQDLHAHAPSDLLFLCYNSAAIMERDYGRQIP